MARPFFNHPIDKLECFFREHRSERELLRKLTNELGHRSTDRARKLCAPPLKRLRELNGESPAEVDLFRERRTEPPPVTPKFEAAEPDEAMASPPKTSPLPRPDPCPLPPITNTPENILSAWTAFEVLSPPSFRRTLSRSNPWCRFPTRSPMRSPNASA